MTRISIIVPVFNEETIIVPFLRNLPPVRNMEVVVADGGSRDRTVPLARGFQALYPLTVCSAPRGRARQMNEGARRATGDILVFLHVDSAISEEGLESALKALEAPEVVGGAFHLRIDSDRLLLKAVAGMANRRSRWWGLPYGDQGLFVRKDVFEKMGGYADLPLMEDVDFIRRLKKEGRVAFLEEEIITSARRWEQEGILYTTLRNLFLLGLYFLGVPPRRFSKWYHP